MSNSDTQNFHFKVTGKLLRDAQILFLLTLISLIYSCGKNRQVKLSNAKEVNLDEIQNEESKNNQKIEPVKYGAGDVVNRGYLDKSGNMWFTTLREGVFKYDGKSFTNFTEKDGLCSNSVSAVIEDKDGLMWFGTANGLCSYEGEKFHNIPIPKDDATSEWLESVYPIVNPDGILSLIQDKNGIFWIGSNGAGAYRYDPNPNDSVGRGKTFTSLLKNKARIHPADGLYHNVITSIIEDKSGNIWFSSFSHGGVTKYDGTTYTHYGIEDGLGDDMISTSYIDRSGNLWFGTRAGGMSRFNPSPNDSAGRGGTFSTIHETEEPCQNHMASLLEDKTGKFWVASFARSGICWFDGKSFRPTGIKESEQLNDIKFISEDKDGNIWFGGRYGILWRYDGEVLTDFTQKGRL